MDLDFDGYVVKKVGLFYGENPNNGPPNYFTAEESDMIMIFLDNGNDKKILKIYADIEDEVTWISLYEGDWWTDLIGHKIDKIVQICDTDVSYTEDGEDKLYHTISTYRIHFEDHILSFKFNSENFDYPKDSIKFTFIPSF